MRLLTIPISHYCERARWALEHAGLEYEEEQHLQMFHARHARRLTGGSTSLPVLVTNDGQVLPDSRDILRFADEHRIRGTSLYPATATERDEVQALEDEYAGRLGVEGRRLMYFHFLDWGRPALHYNAAKAPGWERWTLRVGFPVASSLLRRYLNVGEETATRAHARVLEVFDGVAERLGDGRRYLVGEHFTAADLTFAALAAAVVVPEAYGVELPQPPDLPPSIRTLVEGFREHPAGAYALRIFRDHRH